MNELIKGFHDLWILQRSIDLSPIEKEVALKRAEKLAELEPVKSPPEKSVSIPIPEIWY